jgi:hypothetical protein
MALWHDGSVDKTVTTMNASHTVKPAHNGLEPDPPVV